MRYTVTRRELLSLDLSLVLGLEGDREVYELYLKDAKRLLPIMLACCVAALNTFEAEKLAYLIPTPQEGVSILHGVTRDAIKNRTYRITLLPQWLICVMNDLDRDSLTVEVPDA